MNQKTEYMTPVFRRWLNMTWPERYQFYINHPINQTTNRRGEPGLSCEAQATLHNDWQTAFSDFIGKAF